MSATQLVQSGDRGRPRYGAVDDLASDRSLVTVAEQGTTTARQSTAQPDAMDETRLRQRKAKARVHTNSDGSHVTLGRTSWYSVAFLLENKGSVARDHLALERTYLAWLRTSLALASIGIAITQLFRLPSSTSVPPSTGNAARAVQSQVSQLINSTDVSDVPQIEQILALLVEQSSQIDILKQQVNDPLKYRHLGKPIGGTFIALALLFLVLGSARYFICQSALMLEPQSMFPPSRRSVIFSSSCVGICVVATFVAILVTR
ncbi:hypothetical protein ACM66B_005479 [Microbotryomycetes sp. NB124-2]